MWPRRKPGVSVSNSHALSRAATGYNQRRPGTDDFIFLSDRDGTPYRSWRFAFKMALKKAGVTWQITQQPEATKL
jgi:hypothetical protein